jgi:hypothetical protein
MPRFRIAVPGYGCGSGSTRVKSMGIRIQESLIDVDPDPEGLNQCGAGSLTLVVSHLSPASLATTSVLPSRLTAMQAELLPTCTPKAVLPIANNNRF